MSKIVNNRHSSERNHTLAPPIAPAHLRSIPPSSARCFRRELYPGKNRAQFTLIKIGGNITENKPVRTCPVIPPTHGFQKTNCIFQKIILFHFIFAMVFLIPVSIQYIESPMKYRRDKSFFRPLDLHIFATIHRSPAVISHSNFAPYRSITTPEMNYMFNFQIISAIYDKRGQA